MFQLAAKQVTFVDREFKKGDVIPFHGELRIVTQYPAGNTHIDYLIQDYDLDMHVEAADGRLDAADVNSIVVERKRSLFQRSRATKLGPRGAIRSSLSVIQAYWRRFGTIPPFGGRRPAA